METVRPIRARRTGLEGRTALVLGAVGELGGAAARALAALGARVVVADEDHTTLGREYGGDERFDVLPVNTSSAGDLAALAATLPDIDVLIHQCERADSSDPAPAGSGLDQIRHFVPAMTRRRRGSIIALACPSPRRDRERGAAASAGHELHQAVRGLASELQPFGVRVNAVAPDGVEPAPAVAFLASDSSSHVTGAVLAMERGWSALESIDAAPSRAASVRPLAGTLGTDRVRAGRRGMAAMPVRAHVMDSMMTEEAYERRRA
jgi:2-keto-3-deoxy-L-fuconate dehydrogenase